MRNESIRLTLKLNYSKYMIRLLQLKQFLSGKCLYTFTKQSTNNYK